MTNKQFLQQLFPNTEIYQELDHRWKVTFNNTPILIYLENNRIAYYKTKYKWSKLTDISHPDFDPNEWALEATSYAETRFKPAITYFKPK
jgi:hypothetical protein